MAKVTIELEDNDNGSVKIKVECDPPMEVTSEITEAQIVALFMLKTATEIAEGKNDPRD